MDTSSAKQDEVDIGRDGADVVGGTEPRSRGFPPQPRDSAGPGSQGAGDVASEADGWRRRRRH